jgi:hypothetical protein
MLWTASHRHLPRSPLSRRGETEIRAELRHLATQILNLEKEHQIQVARTAQIQHELDQMKELLRTIAAKLNTPSKR